MAEKKKNAKAAPEAEEVKEETAAETEECVTEAEEAAETCDAEEASGKKEKKDKKDEKIEELNDKYMRLFAEFDNFRNRSEKEKSQMYDYGAKDAILKILPVVDNLERGFAALTDEQKQEPFAAGIEKTYTQLMGILEGMGVTPIEAVGKEFDPEFHMAVSTIEDESLGENVVAVDMQKGYMYKDSVLRHSMVQVANS